MIQNKNKSRYFLFLLYYTFSLQLNYGLTLHGYVRHYLPLHPGVKCSTGVGWRGPRAMVIMTRASGREIFYQTVLKWDIYYEWEIAQKVWKYKPRFNVYRTQYSRPWDIGMHVVINEIIHAMFSCVIFVYSYE